MSRRVQLGGKMQLRRLQMLCLSSAALAALLYALTRCSGAPAVQLAGGLAADDAQPNATLVEICMKLAASPSADALSALPLKDQLAAVQAVESAQVTAASVQHVVSAGAVPRNDFPHDKFGDQYLAMVLVIKGSQDDIREWVVHHRKVGAGRIYIYDDTESDASPVRVAVKDYIEQGFVVYQIYTNAMLDPLGRRHLQMNAWNAALQAHKSKHQFLAFTDIDEFLVPYGGFKTVPQLLRQMQSFEPIGGLVVSWVMFGSSGHKTRPAGGVLQAYTKCVPLQNEHGIHVKSIVNTDYVDIPITPHHFSYTRGKYALSEHFQRVDGPDVKHILGAPTIHYIGNHHYFTKSLQEWQEKAKRGSAMGNFKGVEFFHSVDDAANETCLGAVDFAYAI